MQCSTKQSIKAAYPRSISTSQYSLSMIKQSVCSSAGEMELAWYYIFHNSRITTKWQTLATLKFEWFEVCTDFHGRQWWSLNLLSIQPERWCHISAWLYERQSKYSLRYGGKCFVECKAWHFQHTSNLIYHNTSHLHQSVEPLSAKELRTQQNCGPGETHVEAS